MKEYKDITIGIERAFYASQDAIFSNITIDGPEDGESAFKECKNIELNESTLRLRYPLWHNTNAKLFNVQMFDTCRAALWYCKDVSINSCKLLGIKAVRECESVSIENSEIVSEEFGWKSNNVRIINSNVESVYAFFNTNNIEINKIKFKGKYSFQYCNNITISNSILDTKDAFWHSNNVVVKDSIVKGEYLAWYSSNITFINCKIMGTQPLCYASNIKFINCEFDETTDLAFEYSEVNGDIYGLIKSIKNMSKGELTVKGNPEIIKDEYDRSEGNASINIIRD